MKGQGTETLNSRTYDLSNMRLKSKPLFSSWAPLVTHPSYSTSEMEGRMPSGVSRLGSSIRTLGSQIVCCPAAPSPSPLQEGFFSC